MKERVVGYDSVDLAIIEEHYTIHFREGRKKTFSTRKGRDFSQRRENTTSQSSKPLQGFGFFFVSLPFSTSPPRQEILSLYKHISPHLTISIFSLSLSIQF